MFMLMSLHSAVTTDVSLARPNAGNGGTPGAGVEDMVAEPLGVGGAAPVAEGEQLAAGREAGRGVGLRTGRAAGAPSRAPTVCRSAVISAILATLEARTCSRTAMMSVVPAYRNG